MAAPLEPIASSCSRVVFQIPISAATGRSQAIHSVPPKVWSITRPFIVIPAALAVCTPLTATPTTHWRISLPKILTSCSSRLRRHHFIEVAWQAFISRAAQMQAKLFLHGPYSATSGNMGTLLQSSSAIPLTAPYTEDPRVIVSIPSGITDWNLMVTVRRTANE